MDGTSPTHTLRLSGSFVATAYATASALVRFGTAAAALTTRGFVPTSVGMWLIGRSVRSRARTRSTLPFETFEASTDDGLTLRGWLFRPSTPPRGLLVFLHGKNQSRRGGVRAAERYVPKGFALLTYDQRSHGTSDGAHCTYGVKEVPDLRRILDLQPALPVFLVGESLGAAVALQAASVDPRIRGVVAAASFSDLATAVLDRAGGLDAAPSVARFELEAGVRIADASPINAAANVRAPVLLVHGTRDRSTPLHHSEQILAALAGPKELLRVDGAGHGDLLKHEQVWEHIDAWLARVAS